MAGPLETTQAGLIEVPWTQDETTRAYNGVLGAEKDRLNDRTRSGVKMRWPAGPNMQAVAQDVGASLDPTTGDTKRLALIGAGFNLPRLGSMSDAQYESYLEGAWNVHQLGGTLAAITNALNAYGIPDVEVVEEWQAMGGSWANPGAYGHRICVILGPNYGTLGWQPMGFPFIFPPAEFEQGHVYNNRTAFVLGIWRMFPNQLADIARIIRTWKDGGCTPIKLVFRFTVNGVTSPVFGVAGVPFPIPLSSAPDAVTFYMTGHYFNEEVDGNGDTEGVPLPLPFGPVYTLDGSE